MLTREAADFAKCKRPCHPHASCRTTSKLEFRVGAGRLVQADQPSPGSQVPIVTVPPRIGPKSAAAVRWPSTTSSVAGTSRARRRQGVAHSAGGAGTATGTGCSARRSKISLIASARSRGVDRRGVCDDDDVDEVLDARAASAARVDTRVRVELLREVLLDPERRHLNAVDVRELEEIRGRDLLRLVNRRAGERDVDDLARSKILPASVAATRHRCPPPGRSVSSSARSSANVKRSPRSSAAASRSSSIASSSFRRHSKSASFVLRSTLPRRSSSANPPLSTEAGWV
jgi:hypothetical protein